MSQLFRGLLVFPYNIDLASFSSPSRVYMADSAATVMFKMTHGSSMDLQGMLSPKPFIAVRYRVDVSPKPESPCIRSSGENGRGSKGSSHKPVVYYRFPGIVPRQYQQQVESTQRSLTKAIQSHQVLIKPAIPHQSRVQSIK